jgi:phosphoglucomutase|tara:strand:+ start:204 stop:419 length:216 start_codon:yes stop_codon:yes gene_type:complete
MKVWIELEVDDSPEKTAEAANRMMRRLGFDYDVFWWHEKEGSFCGNQSAAGNYHVLEDNGEWFNLEWLGRE